MPGRDRVETLHHPDVRFTVRLTPRAVTDRVDGVLDGVLKARVTAPAVEGAANHALVRLLADELDVAHNDVRIVAGATSRQKMIVVSGVEPEAIVARWPGLRV
jgi:hypothetical protein